MSMSLVAKYPDRLEIIPELIATGVEELEHFQQVYEVMRERGHRRVNRDGPVWIKALMTLTSDSQRRFLDRLLLASIIECRGAERFRGLSEAMTNDEQLRVFYHELWVSEGWLMATSFVKMVFEYFLKEHVYERSILSTTKRAK